MKKKERYYKNNMELVTDTIFYLFLAGVLFIFTYVLAFVSPLEEVIRAYSEWAIAINIALAIIFTQTLNIMSYIVKGNDITPQILMASDPGPQYSVKFFVPNSKDAVWSSMTLNALTGTTLGILFIWMYLQYNAITIMSYFAFGAVFLFCAFLENGFRLQLNMHNIIAAAFLLSIPVAYLIPGFQKLILIGMSSIILYEGIVLFERKLLSDA